MWLHRTCFLLHVCSPHFLRWSLVRSADKLETAPLAGRAALQAVVEQLDLVNDHLSARREEMAYQNRRVQA